MKSLDATEVLSARVEPSRVRAPVLLLMAEYNGTLAAVRCLADRGVSVVLATASVSAPARWSNGVAEVVRCPGFREGPRAIVDWLIAYGRDHIGTVLYPTCDEMAWLISLYREELAPFYALCSPEANAIRSILDKKALYEAAARVGIDSPGTWYPQTEEDLRAVFEAAHPCIVKPRTQTFFVSHAKGGVATTLPELVALWSQYRAAHYHAAVLADMKGIEVPMVQKFLPSAAKSVYSITGFVAADGSVLASRGSNKVLQHPPRAGIGLCFESMEPDASLTQRLASLCRDIGYYGVFEAEFIRDGEREVLIDFNPRYFGQMGFDIARGMALPWIAYLSAVGNHTGAQQAAHGSLDGGSPRYYVDSLALRWYLTAGRLFGGVSRSERRRWLDWLDANRGATVDAIAAERDRAPWFAALAARLWYSARHPRAFWRIARKA